MENIKCLFSDETIEKAKRLLQQSIVKYSYTSDTRLLGKFKGKPFYVELEEIKNGMYSDDDIVAALYMLYEENMKIRIVDRYLDYMSMDQKASALYDLLVNHIEMINEIECDDQKVSFMFNAMQYENLLSDIVVDLNSCEDDHATKRSMELLDQLYQETRIGRMDRKIYASMLVEYLHYIYFTYEKQRSVLDQYILQHKQLYQDMVSLIIIQDKNYDDHVNEGLNPDVA